MLEDESNRLVNELLSYKSKINFYDKEINNEYFFIEIESFCLDNKIQKQWD